MSFEELYEAEDVQKIMVVINKRIEVIDTNTFQKNYKAILKAKSKLENNLSF